MAQNRPLCRNCCVCLALRTPSGACQKRCYSLIVLKVPLNANPPVLCPLCSDASPSLVDPPEHLFRIRLVCVLLETCGQYFDRGSSKKKLDCFLVYFQVWLHIRHIKWQTRATYSCLASQWLWAWAVAQAVRWLCLWRQRCWGGNCGAMWLNLTSPLHRRDHEEFVKCLLQGIRHRHCINSDSYSVGWMSVAIKPIAGSEYVKSPEVKRWTQKKSWRKQNVRDCLVEGGWGRMFISSAIINFFLHFGFKPRGLNELN